MAFEIQPAPCICPPHWLSMLQALPQEGAPDLSLQVTSEGYGICPGVADHPHPTLQSHVAEALS